MPRGEGVDAVIALLRGLAHTLVYLVLTVLGLPFLSAVWLCMPEAL